jgi:hypothetical protein
MPVGGVAVPLAVLRTMGLVQGGDDWRKGRVRRHRFAFVHDQTPVNVKEVFTGNDVPRGTHTVTTGRLRIKHLQTIDDRARATQPAQ